MLHGTTRRAIDASVRQSRRQERPGLSELRRPQRAGAGGESPARARCSLCLRATPPPTPRRHPPGWFQGRPLIGTATRILRERWRACVLHTCTHSSVNRCANDCMHMLCARTQALLRRWRNSGVHSYQSDSVLFQLTPSLLTQAAHVIEHHVASHHIASWHCATIPRSTLCRHVTLCMSDHKCIAPFVIQVAYDKACTSYLRVSFWQSL